jgi:hypothetical protein
MELSTNNKTEILLNVLDFNIKEINRKEEEQQKLFEWSTGLLLAAFAAVVALSGRTTPFLFIHRIMTRTKDAAGNADAVETIEETLHLFEDGYYGARSPYPKEWQGRLGEDIRKDKLPTYYALIIGLMVACVVTAIWLLL